MVEGHDDSYELLTEVLTPQNPRLHRTYNGEEAIAMIKSNTYDLILMDINLPVLDGLSVTKDIRKTNKTVSIIAQTAHAMESEREKILTSGCND